MNPELLRESGEALFGPQWQAELARTLDVADRTIRRWVSGEFNIPESVGGELKRLLKDHGLAIAAIRRKLPRG